MATESRQFYASSNGDRWLLVRHTDGDEGNIFVRHEPNTSSGGKCSEQTIDKFLDGSPNTAEAKALIDLFHDLKSKHHLPQ